jgi:hypothetical protein
MALGHEFPHQQETEEGALRLPRANREGEGNGHNRDSGEMDR